MIVSSLPTAYTAKDNEDAVAEDVKRNCCNKMAITIRSKSEERENRDKGNW